LNMSDTQQSELLALCVRKSLMSARDAGCGPGSMMHRDRNILSFVPVHLNYYAYANVLQRKNLNCPIIFWHHGSLTSS
jgi:hypothetical protein